MFGRTYDLCLFSMGNYSDSFVFCDISRPSKKVNLQ